MPKKKQRKSAFAYFLKEYHHGQLNNGRTISKKIASSECSYLWNTLQPEKRHEYCEMANPMKQKVNKQGKVEPVPENMEWLDPITGEYGEKWFRYVRAGDETNYLRTTIQTVKDTKTYSFYVVHFNYFCRTAYKKYVPAEVAIVEFSLLEGVKREFHRIINPGNIPLGFAAEAKKMYETVHGIEPPSLSKGEDLEKVETALRRFLKHSKYDSSKNSGIPPLFALQENILPAMHMLNDMVEYTEDDPVFKVYPVHKMFYFIKNKASDISANSAGFLDELAAQREIDRDCFRFVLDIACEYHQKIESKFPSCSLSIARRLAYMICYHCCEHLEIPLIAGVHVHRNFYRVMPREADKGASDNSSVLGAAGGDKGDSLSDDSTDDDDDYLFKNKIGPLSDYERMTKWYNETLRHMITSFAEEDPDEEEERNLEYYLNNPELDEKPGEHRFYVRLTPKVEGEDEREYEPTPEEQMAAFRRNENRRIRDRLIARMEERMTRRACEAAYGTMGQKPSGGEVASEGEEASGGEVAPRAKVASGGEVASECEEGSGAEVAPRAKVASGRKVTSGAKVASGGKVATRAKVASRGKVASKAKVTSEGEEAAGGKVASKSKVAARGEKTSRGKVAAKGDEASVGEAPSEDEVASGAKVVSKGEVASGAKVASDGEIAPGTKVASEGEVASKVASEGEEAVSSEEASGGGGSR